MVSSDVRVTIDWTPQPAAPGTVRGELSWQADAGSGARLASALRDWCTCASRSPRSPAPAPRARAGRHTPTLGLHHAIAGVHGDILVREDRLRAALARAASDPATSVVEELHGAARQGLGRRARDLPLRRRRRPRPLAAPGRLTGRRPSRPSRVPSSGRRGAATAGCCRAGPGWRGRRRSRRRSPTGSRLGSTTSSITPICCARASPPASFSCSAASSASTSPRTSAGTSASRRRCRMRTAATAPITATSAPGQANTRVAPERARVHRDVGAAVRLAGHQRHPRHGGLGERVQQLGAAADHAVPLLADAGQVAGHVHDDHQRHAERVAHPHEPGGLLRRRRVEAAAEPQRVVGDDARPCGRRAGRGWSMTFGAHFGCSSMPRPVEQVRDQRVHVVGAPPGLRQERRRGPASAARSADLAPGQPSSAAQPAGRGAGASSSVGATTCTTPDRRPCGSGPPSRSACRRPRRSPSARRPGR